MKNSIAKLLTLLLFLGVLIGTAFWMYNKFVKDKPKIKVEEQRTNYDRMKADSTVRAQPGYKR